MKAIIKYNSGMLALLCSSCRVIIKTGNQFNEQEKNAAKGEQVLPPVYCDECKNRPNANLNH